MYMYIHIHIYTYTYAFKYTYISSHIYIHIHIHTQTHIVIHTFFYIVTHMYKYIYIYINISYWKSFHILFYLLQNIRHGYIMNSYVDGIPCCARTRVQRTLEGVQCGQATWPGLGGHELPTDLLET